MRVALLAAALLRTTALQSTRPIQVVVDVDDTVKSSGNVRLLDIPLGGIDAQYERGEFYPGVCDFCFELASARSDPEPVAVLTARAEEFAFALKLDDDDKVVKTFRDCGRRRKVQWGVATDRVLYGSAHEWIFQDFKGWQRPASRCVESIHAIDATRVHQTRSWVVSVSISRPFGPRRETAMLHAGASS